MSITMRDIRRHSSRNETKESPYCPKKSKAAYEFSLMERVERANITEKAIAEKIEHHTGHQATVTIHNHPWDITVDLDKPKRIEVKSSLYRPRDATNSKSSYSFVNITPEHFDYLFIVFVTPKGTIEKWAHAKDVKKLCKNKKRYPTGYVLNYTLNSTHGRAAALPECFHDMEDFPYGN